MAQANEYRQKLRAAFAPKTERRADAAEVATVATRTLACIASKLNPVIGKAGVVALYKRSLHLASLTYPWLSSSAPDEIDASALGSMLSQQGADTAAEAAVAVLQTFCDLLASLVGVALTDRLLHTVWVDL